MTTGRIKQYHDRLLSGRRERSCEPWADEPLSALTLCEAAAAVYISHRHKAANSPEARVDFFPTIVAMIPGADDAAKLRFVIVGAGGLGALWGAIRWLRKKDIGTTTRTTLETVKFVDERARADSERLRHLESLVESLQATLEARFAALPNPSSPGINGQAGAAIVQDLNAAVHRLLANGQEQALLSLEAGDERAALTALSAMQAQAGQARAATEKEEAELTRELGALACLSDLDEGLRYYSMASEMDPEDAEGWMKLGLLNRRAGDAAAAKLCDARASALRNASPL